MASRVTLISATAGDQGAGSSVRPEYVYLMAGSSAMYATSRGWSTTRPITRTLRDSQATSACVLDADAEVTVQGETPGRSQSRGPGTAAWWERELTGDGDQQPGSGTATL